MAMNLNPKSPLMIGALLLGGFWLLSKRSAAAAAAANKAQVIKNGQQSYNTPTSVAQLLGAFVASYTKGAEPTVREDNVSTPTTTSGLFSDWAKANYGDSMSASSLGVWDWSTDKSSSIFGAWTKPTPSLVGGLIGGGSGATDAALGSVYNLTDDFKLNPLPEGYGLY